MAVLRTATATGRRSRMAKGRAAAGATVADVAVAAETAVIVQTAAIAGRPTHRRIKVRSNRCTPSSWKSTG